MGYDINEKIPFIYKDKSFAVSNCILKFFFALLIPKGEKKPGLVGQPMAMYLLNTLWEMYSTRNSKLNVTRISVAIQEHEIILLGFKI